jgi:hypothetical protein
MHKRSNRGSLASGYLIGGQLFERPSGPWGWNVKSLCLTNIVLFATGLALYTFTAQGEQGQDDGAARAALGARQGLVHLLGDGRIPCGLGINIHFAHGYRSDIRRIRDLEFRLVRTDLLWADIERERGRYDWRRPDELVRDLKEGGLVPLLILDYSNPLYAPRVAEYPETPSLAYAPPEQGEARAAFMAFARNSVNRYGADVIWEVWDEPNLNFGTPFDLGGCVDFAMDVCRQIRSVSAEAAVIGPAAAGFDTRLTARQAIAMAGGYELAHVRLDNPAMVAAGLRDEADAIWTEVVRQELQLVRLRVELDRKPNADLRVDINTPVPSHVVAELARLEMEQLNLSLATDSKDEECISRSVEQAEHEIVRSRSRRSSSSMRYSSRAQILKGSEEASCRWPTSRRTLRSRLQIPVKRCSMPVALGHSLGVESRPSSWSESSSWCGDCGKPEDVIEVIWHSKSALWDSVVDPKRRDMRRRAAQHRPPHHWTGRVRMSGSEARKEVSQETWLVQSC